MCAGARNCFQHNGLHAKPLLLGLIGVLQARSAVDHRTLLANCAGAGGDKRSVTHRHRCTVPLTFVLE